MDEIVNEPKEVVMSDEFLNEPIEKMHILKRKALGKRLFHGIKASDINDLAITIMENVPPDNLKSAVVKSAGRLSETDKKVAIQETTSSLPPEQQKKVGEEIVRRSSGGMVPPKEKTVDKLWLIVVSAFAFVLVSSFAAIAVSMFKSPAEGTPVKPELILTMFTGVVGFLAGVFVPSPTANNQQ